MEVSTSSYQFAHGRSPRGSGTWAFVASGQTAFFTGTYTQARTQAVAWARTVGASRVVVGS